MPKDIQQLKFADPDLENMHQDALQSLIDSLDGIVNENEVVIHRERYLCPINNKPFKYPVIASDGRTYDKESIDNARSTYRSIVSVETGELLDLNQEMRQDRDIAQEINQFIASFNNTYYGRDNEETGIASRIKRQMLRLLANCRRTCQQVLGGLITAINFVKLIFRFTIALPLYMVVTLITQAIRSLFTLLRSMVSRPRNVTEEPHVAPSISSNEQLQREDFICPIHNTVFTDPVRASDGVVYNKDAIATWYHRQRERGEPLSPITRAPLSNRFVYETQIANRINQLINEHNKNYNAGEFALPTDDSSPIYRGLTFEGIRCCQKNTQRQGNESHQDVLERLVTEHIAKGIKERGKRQSRTSQSDTVALQSSSIWSQLERDRQNVTSKVQRFLSSCSRAASQEIARVRNAFWLKWSGTDLIYYGRHIQQIDIDGIDPSSPDHDDALRKIVLDNIENSDRTVEDFTCPISSCIFTTPVRASDNRVYELSSILQWRESQTQGRVISRYFTSPITRETLLHSLTYDETLATEINEMIDRHNRGPNPGFAAT